MSDLIAIMLELRSPTGGTLPADLGRANYAATLRLIEQHDAALAQHIHDADSAKPLTCSDLIGAKTQRDSKQIPTDHALYVRLTGLTAPVSAALRAGLLDQTPAVWELDGHPFEVVTAVCDAENDAWTGQSDYQHFADLLMGTAPLDRAVRLTFASPISFKRHGNHMPVPLPDLLFGSLVQRWNAFAPMSLSEEMRRFGEQRIVMTRLHLHSRAVRHKRGALRIGSVGDVTYRSLSGDRYWLGVMHVLARYALYAGAGVQTTTGMGQVRLVA